MPTVERTTFSMFYWCLGNGAVPQNRPIKYVRVQKAVTKKRTW